MNERLVETAFNRLFPGEKLTYAVKLKFSKKFSPYNANVRKLGNNLIFSFSTEWKKVNHEITLGLAQELLLKILGGKRATTTNTELYNNFIRNLYLSAKKTGSDEKLQNIFNKVNEAYFSNSAETPNLKWGLNSRTKLATYDYHTDTIRVSSLFKEAEEELVAYLLYHEMLHKKLKFSSSGSGKTIHHSKKFRELEKRFENQQQIEKRLSSFVKEKRAKQRRFLPF